MHSTFISPETFIKFIDARGQHFHPYMGRMPLNNIADAQYDELMMKGGERKKVNKSVNAWVYPLSWPDFNEKYSSHVGTVMNIYIGERFFYFTNNNKKREQIILHEYSHKALLTVDYAVTRSNLKNNDCEFIYSEEECQDLATEKNLEAIRNADCWGYFLRSFTEVEATREDLEFWLNL